MAPYHWQQPSQPPVEELCRCIQQRSKPAALVAGAQGEGVSYRTVHEDLAFSETCPSMAKSQSKHQAKSTKHQSEEN